MARFRVSLLVALFLLSAALFVALPGSGGAQSVNHLVISEVMYDPLPPGAESDLEWAEIHNPAGAPITLNGWTLRDNTAQDTIPTFSLAPGAFLVIVANEAAFRGRYPSFSGNLVALGGPIGNGLSNTGDRLMLLDAQGREVDALSYGSDTTMFDPACPRVSEGQSLARVPSSQDTDSVADWAAQMSPNPGEAGVPPTATPSPTGTATPSPSATASATRTPTVSPSVGPTASPTHTAAPVATPTPTASPSPTNSPTASPKLLLSEVFYDAPQAGTDSDYEWVELFNPSAAPVDLAGWKLRDNTTEDAIPRFVLAPGEYLVVAATAAGFAANNPGFMGHLVSLEGSIGGGLGNTGDRVLLIAPDGTTTVDAMSYGSDIGGFNPACPNAPVGGSLARIPLAPDTDSAADWIVQHAPNPGAGVTAPIPTATRTPTPTSTVTPLWSPTSSATGTPTRTVTATSTGTPTPAATLFAQGIVLNEVLPDPDQIDWNGDGQARFDDEWIELYNLGAAPANLGGWAVADATQAYTIPLGTMIWPRGYLLLYRSQTHRTLGDDRGAVSLLRPDGGAADSFVYAVGPGADLSYCRSSDGSGAWLRGCLPTPGMANRGLPPPTAEKPPPEPSPDEDRDRDVRSGYAPAAPLTIAAARSTRDGTMATVAGRVTMLPGPLGRRIYLEDETGGIQVYLRRGEFPLMALGDQVRVTGWVAEFHGERQIEVSSADRIAVTGRDALLSPRRLRTSQIGEAHEGRLAWVFGRVVRASKSGVTLDDGSGPAYIYFPEELPWQHPYVKIGEMWGAQGVVGQYASQTPYADGYRLIPRLATDFSRAPLTLPATGVDFP